MLYVEILFLMLKGEGSIAKLAEKKLKREIEKRNRRNHRMLNQNDKNYKDIVGDLKNEQKTGSYMSISQVVKAAKKEGLTYGQYVIKYHV